MMEFADLEIGLHRRDAGAYAIEFRFSQPNSETEVRLGQAQPAQATFDLDELIGLVYDPLAYGQALTQSFFTETAVRTAFAQARASAQSLGAPLRVRLLIGSTAGELQSLHWELLRDPQQDSQLATSENLLFSRYLSSRDWRPVQVRAKGELRALVVVAGPSNLADYGLTPIDVEGELTRARDALGGIPASFLPDSGSSQRASLNNLITLLRKTEYDILYLVCHGALIKSEPWLWLEDDQGKVARASGMELVTRLDELQTRPRLLVLASCESAGADAGDALTALGPRLAEAGIPAVLAMQGKISIETVAQFMPAFFLELQKDGQIDRALAAARGVIRKRHDFWMPVLFMRLKSGRVWYVPGFAGDREEFEKWSSLSSFVHDRTCTPILGPGLIDNIIGSRRDIAVRWAERHGFPLAAQDRENIQQVAQYLLTRQSPAYMPVIYREALREAVLCRHREALPTELQQAATWSTPQLQRALELVSDHYSNASPSDPYDLLARLRLPIYVTTSTLDFMTQALVRAGVEPVVRICPWNKWIPREKAIYEEEPTPEKPLVYHLFGHLSVPNSPVLAEDTFFDYLIGMTQNKSLIPSSVRAALSSSSLLFLGFQMDDWEFRVFFRFLMGQEGKELLKLYSHAAAQIEPEETRILDVKRARKYLEEYFESEHIAIFWGSSQEFLKALWQHM